MSEWEDEKDTFTCISIKGDSVVNPVCGGDGENDS